MDQKEEEHRDPTSSPGTPKRKKKSTKAKASSPVDDEKPAKATKDSPSTQDAPKRSSSKPSKSAPTDSSNTDSPPPSADHPTDQVSTKVPETPETSISPNTIQQEASKAASAAISDSVSTASSSAQSDPKSPESAPEKSHVQSPAPSAAEVSSVEAKAENASTQTASAPVAASPVKMAPRASIVVQRRRNNPLQKPVGWNFAPGESLDPKVHSKHAKRQNIALEISSTENSYVSVLKHLYDAFVVPCQLFATPTDVGVMFGNLGEILQLHQDLAREITERVNHWNYSTIISDIFKQYIPRMKIYSTFINTYDKGAALITELSQMKGSKFLELLNAFASLPSSHGLDMGAYRINPVQRLPRLCLLLEDLLRNTIETHPDYQGVKDALASLKEVSLAVNAAKGVAVMQEHFESLAKRLVGWSNGTAKACKQPLITENRRLVIQDTAMTLYGPNRAVPVSLALFNDGLLIMKRSEDNKTKQLDFMDWILVRETSLRKIGTKQVSKISKDWKAQLEVDSYHWLELQVDEKETFLLGVSELKFWHDWPNKFRATNADMRSKYWSVLTSVNQHSPPPCAYGTLTHYPSTATFIYFGGISNKLLNAFYSYDLRTRQWVSITAIGGPPPALAKHSANLVGSKIWFYGGLVKNTVTVSNDLYTYDVPNNTWSGPIATTGDVPSRGRAGHTMTTVGSKLYLVGGATFDDKKQEVILDEMFEFDTETKKWTAHNKAPIARHGHVTAALEGKLYTWGGRSPGSEYSTDVSVFDFAVRDWSEAPILTGFVPNARQWASGAPVQGRHLLVLGGKRDVLMNDVYLLDVNAGTWCRYSIPCVLEHRMSASIQVVENPKDGIISIYIFGGLQLNAETMDTTVYSDQFITFQLHNKYIQQTAKPPTWTNLRQHAVAGLAGTLASTSSSARFNFVSKSAQPAGTQVAKVESSSALCSLQRTLASESRFGEIWLGEHSRTHLAFAVKVMKKPVQRDTTEEWKQLMRAIETAQKCKSPFLTTYMGLMDQPATESFWILSEYCKYGSVKDYLASGNKLREPQLQLLASVMISALQSLHSAGLVHGNLRASNVLLTDSLEFKVCDFALISALEALLKPASTWNSWDAPEVLLGGAPTPKSDVFALGVTLIEMAEYAPPHKALNTKRRWSAQMEDFVHKATKESESLRPDLDTLSNHPWIRSAKTSEKLQLDLADMMKKVFSKESKKRTYSTYNAPAPGSPATSPTAASTSVVPPIATSAATNASSASTIPSSPNSVSPTAQPGSGRIPREKKTSSDSLNFVSSTEETSDADEVITLKARNAVLRKKLRLLKKAYEELSQENAKLKEQLEPTQPNSSSGAAGDAEDSSEAAPSSPGSESPLERSSSNSSIKIKRRDRKSVV